MNTIFQGKSGLFKREQALAAARAILNPDCLDFHPDFLMVEPEKGKIPVSEVNKIAEFLSYSTVDAEKKVIVIDKCHLATVEFQQAILKLLEDQSSRAVFLLTTEESLLPTIHSRCRTVSVKEWSYERMMEWIKDKKIQMESTVLCLAEGRPGLYLELLADKEFVSSAERFRKKLENQPEKAVVESGFLDENHYDTERKEKELLFISFVERYISQHLLDMKLTVDQGLEIIDLCSEERVLIKNRSYGKTENFQFYRRLHSILN